MIGGGSTALEEALYLSNIASEVIMVHRRDKFRGEKILQNKVIAKENINIQWDSVLDEVLGDEMGVTGMRIRHVQSQDATEFDLHGVFIAIGHTPEHIHL